MCFSEDCQKADAAEKEGAYDTENSHQVTIMTNILFL